MFIEFGILNLKLLIILIYPIGLSAQYYIDFFYSTLYLRFLVYLSFLPAGLIYLIVLLRSKRKNKTEILVNAEKGSAVSQLDHLQKKEAKKKKIKEKISIFFLSLLFFLPNLLQMLFFHKFPEIILLDSQKLYGVVMFCFFMIFSKLILHEKIYKHRVISIIVICICYTIIIIREFYEIEIKSFLILLINNVLASGIDALFCVLVKKHFNTYLMDPYLFMFYLGLFSLLILTPFEIIYYLFFGGNSEILGEGVISQIKSNSEDFLKNFRSSLLLILLFSFTYGSQILTIYHFTPCHFIISSIIFLIVFPIIGDEADFVGINKIVFIIAFIIILIFSLVYNEIIIIKLCSLEKYTAKYISIREKNEYENSDQICNDDESLIECEELDNKK